MAAADPAKPVLERPQVERILYQGLSTTRFTQDTPVLPDVWLSFAEHPRERLSVLITPLQDQIFGYTQPGQLAMKLEERLALNRDPKISYWDASWRERESPEVVYNRTTVNATLWFDELVRVVLPLSHWWRQRVAPQPADWPLWLLNDPRPSIRNEARRQLVEALKLSDSHVRGANRDVAIESARSRARLAFNDERPITQATAGTTEAADHLESQTAKELTYHERFEAIANLGRAVAQGTEGKQDWVRRLAAQPDVLWMVRLVGTLGALFQQRLGMKGSPALRECVDPAEHERYLAMLETYYRRVVGAAAELMQGMEALRVDPAAPAPQPPLPLVHSVSRCRAATMAISQSRATVKCDAAVQLFNITCRNIAWAVVDSGIDATHPAFLSREDGRPRVLATYDFTFFRELLREGRKAAAGPENGNPRLRPLFAATNAKQATELRTALQNGRELDWEALAPFVRVWHDAERYLPPIQEHGTHVAGIIGADCPDLAGGGEPNAAVLHRGMCPEIRLYDFRVLGDDGLGDEFNVMAALQFIRYLNAHRDVPAIHGVNLSLSIPHAVMNYACGRTPICIECERLVSAGVVVVAAAGNEGYLEYMTGKGLKENYRNISITDPGNSEAVITVGATHRFEPHNYGVSYFSSRGPTGDGRAKPDLVAPGEKIESSVPGSAYKSMDGTSMAAPHVSGGAALLLARHRELIGQPERVKQVLCGAATDLGRERYFQGAGMLDVLRALQSV